MTQAARRVLAPATLSMARRGQERTCSPETQLPA